MGDRFIAAFICCALIGGGAVFAVIASLYIAFLLFPAEGDWNTVFAFVGFCGLFIPISLVVTVKKSRQFLKS